MIGNDLLPNVYIDKVNVYDGAFEASVYCVDSIDSPVWSDHALSMKYFKIMVVSTHHFTLINNFRFGVAKMDPKSILKEDPNAVITYHPIKNTTKIQNKGYSNYKTMVKHSYSDSNPSLYLYAALVVDPVQIAGPKFVMEQFITGPVVSEAIFAGNEISTSSTVWTLPDGTQWVGPVHRHPTEGYMQFSSHSDQPHQKVTQTIIRNIKVKDLRKKEMNPSRLSSKKNDITEVSELYSSFSTEGNSNSIFFVNIKQIISKNTKFGNVFLSLKPEYHMPIINDFSFRLINVERQMVRTAFIGNKKRINKILQTKKVLSAYQQGDVFITTFGDNVIRKTAFPIDNDLIALEFTDQEANVNLSGQFQYNVSLFFKDPTIAQSQQIIDELKNASTIVDKYLGRIVRNLKTNEQRNNPPQSWIDSENSIYADDISRAPWIMAPKIFAKYKKMFFETDDSYETIEFDSYTMLEPRSFTMNSINKFKSNLNLITMHVNKAFNVRTDPVSNFSDISMPKNSYVSNLIEKKFHFSKIFEPSKNKKFYNVMEETQGQQFTKRITLNDFKNRVSTEFKKFFNENQQTKSDDIETNLEISMASYFSPLSLSSFGGDKIDLSDLSNIDKQNFNAFFDNVPMPRFKKRRRPSKKQKFTIMPRLIPIEEEDYIEASEYLGEDSNFLSAEERENFKQVKKASVKTMNNLSNTLTRTKSKAKQKISKGKTNNIFKPDFIARAPVTPSGRTLIPNQFRSFNVGLVPAAKDTFTSEEIQQAENDLLVSVNYLTLTQIESLVDFETTPDGVKIMNSPIWQLVTAEQLDDLSTGVLCKMETIKSPVSNFEADPRTDLPFSDKYFIISDVELPASNETEETDEDMTLSNSYSASTEYDLAGASSEILEQNVTFEEQIFKVNIEEFDVEATPTTRTVAAQRPRTTQRTTTRAARITRTNTGGGY